MRRDRVEMLQRRGLPRVAKALDGTISPERDELLPWMEMANAGMFNHGNPHLVDLAVRNMPDGAVLEIGAFCGLSTNIIRRSLDRHDRSNEFWTFDPWDYGTGPIGDSPVSYETYSALVRDNFQRACEAFSGHDLPHAIHADSARLFDAWDNRKTVTDLWGREAEAGGPLAFCFIDGEHDWDNVARDFANCDKHLAPGGFVLFDDSSPAGGHPDVHRFVRHLPGRYEVVGRNPNWLVQRH